MTAPPRKPPTVLLVDDEAGLRRVLERFLERNGYRVLSTGTAEAAYELLASRRRELEQRVDEEPIAFDRRNASGRCVRRFDEPELFEIGHDVANRRGTQVQTGLARQRARAYRLSVADVSVDEKAQ